MSEIEVGDLVQVKDSGCILGVIEIEKRDQGDRVTLAYISPADALGNRASGTKEKPFPWHTVIDTISIGHVNLYAKNKLNVEK